MKKAVAVVIVLTIIVNLIGFGILTPKSQAVAGAIITYVAAPAVIGLLSSVLGKKIADTAQLYSDKIEVTNRINSQAIQNGELIAVQCTHYTGDDTYSYKLVPVQGLSGETAEEVNFICDYMNNQGNINTAIAGFMLNNGDNGQNFYHGDIKAEVYEALSTDAVNAYTAYVEAKRHDISLNDFYTGISELASALGHEWSPNYHFDFEGPISPIEFEALSSFSSDVLDYNGFRLYPAHIALLDSNGKFVSEAAANSYVAGIPNSLADSAGWYDSNWEYHNAYNGVIQFESNTYQFIGHYVIYNGELYFRKTSVVNNGNGSSLAQPPQGELNKYISASGVSLSDAGCTSISDCYTGIYVKPTSSTASGDRPENLTVDDITDDVDPLSFDYLYTDDELPVSAAMAAGIVSSNADLTIDENGNIVAADGITLAQLQSIADQIMEGQLQFEDFEEYLNYITALLMKANVDRLTQTDVINSLRAYEQQQANALNQINANIASISTAITAAQEAELDLPDNDEDIYTVQHTGLAEATAIVSGLSIVQQISTLFDILYDPDKYTDKAPSFSFYWDSNKDGTTEKYTALDLSFMENTLSNENLEDKDRFKDPMTVREFIQLIIITLCYIGFAFKVLRKLPSLIGGSESVSDTGLQYEAAQRTALSRKDG